MWKVVVVIGHHEKLITVSLDRSLEAGATPIANAHDSDKAYYIRESNSCCNEMHICQCSPVCRILWFGNLIAIPHYYDIETSHR